MVSQIYTDKIGLEYRVATDPATDPNNPNYMIQVRGNSETAWHIATTFNYTPLDSFTDFHRAEKYLIENIERIL